MQVTAEDQIMERVVDEGLAVDGDRLAALGDDAQ
jgi:hypothetical protein